MSSAHPPSIGAAKELWIYHKTLGALAFFHNVYILPNMYIYMVAGIQQIVLALRLFAGNEKILEALILL